MQQLGTACELRAAKLGAEGIFLCLHSLFQRHLNRRIVVQYIDGETFHDTPERRTKMSKGRNPARIHAALLAQPRVTSRAKWSKVSNR